MVVRIGTSGWNYPTGKGTWNGIFYPLPEDGERGFDELRFYADRFNTVEVARLDLGPSSEDLRLIESQGPPALFEGVDELGRRCLHRPR